MTIKQIYNLAIEMGIEADLRGKEKVKKYLARQKEKYQKLDAKKKKEFNMERLTNPYSDTRILNLPSTTFQRKVTGGETNKPIKKILAGIDIEVGELLLAKELGGVDLVISHHPHGMALANLDDVMHLQADVLAQYGVPINIAESLLKLRISEVSRSISPANHNRVVDAAKLLNLGFMCVHTATDNLLANFLDKKIKKDKPEYVGDVLKSLKEIPEYKEAIKIGAGPRLFAGDEDWRCGKIALTEITGGTDGSPKIYEKMSQAGIGTIIGMHMTEEYKKEAEAAHINVVIAGHMSSDSIGLNLFLDQLKKRGIKIIPCAGLIRNF
ncbi:MAG: NGG1p interacting factor NIF3 [Candidatus Portnoybacteria bacterium RIFCSPLOWO2_01_FULL_43_11]|uniref:NGG1p interacting factor NIF3 n=3 Tax=Bacteria candidate phyla TaxID=1783234 RepID=A0A1G2FNA4_9BACT|nr:MAG: NGG1p interacting factor NIF3 [candidate division WWE3 bacterium RIFCSPHIGHO2_01_FULL_35_17]OGZ38312.1 MAG: NGG1p interacting factor NIF3 [Candidatus Portnoybacteria bacterium RIFCSPLOWO2_01_FULL_43_11]OGZ39090.1 MAG: NGG1p interacting factor NIF3 [Candidatus Portnoybacteria bacterium RIFCSPHIGHO2_12_FULL_40_11]